VTDITGLQIAKLRRAVDSSNSWLARNRKLSEPPLVRKSLRVVKNRDYAQTPS
jgi:hypothetical protein